MSLSIQTARPGPNRINFPKYVLISLLTILTIGPQYFLNVSFTVNQIVIQSWFSVNSEDMLVLSILSNLAFTLCIPIGPAIARSFGVKRSYITFVAIFLCGSIINLISPNVTLLIIGRLIQGLSAGALFLTVLPISLTSFPGKVRNQFLLLAIGGLFGSSAVGAFLGSLSLNMDTWRWLFIVSVFASILSLWIGYHILPEHQTQTRVSIDKWGVLLLSLFIIVLAFPLSHLQEKGFSSLYVWPFFAVDLILLAIFLTVDWYAENPLFPWRELIFAKPLFGTVMGVSGHIALIIGLAGSNGILRSIIDTPFVNIIYYYLWFFAGIMVSAVFCTLLYDKWGAGSLGLIGSLAVIWVSWRWTMMGDEVSLSTLFVQIALLGFGISMTLITGALGTALAGDLHKASKRSVSLHFTRNLFGAMFAPVLGWFLFRQNDIHYENIRAQINEYNPAVIMKLADLTQQFYDSGHTAAEAKNLALTSLAVMARKASVLSAYHDLFTILLWLGIIMTAASIGKAITGKGRSLVSKEASKSNSVSLSIIKLPQSGPSGNH